MQKIIFCLAVVISSLFACKARITLAAKCPDRVILILFTRLIALPHIFSDI